MVKIGTAIEMHNGRHGRFMNSPTLVLNDVRLANNPCVTTFKLSSRSSSLSCLRLARLVHRLPRPSSEAVYCFSPYFGLNGGPGN